ncbi:MAG: nucleoside monophosphate kinase [bacterium]|nr:nucleoside monophosphate kinase [bacterium]
MKKIIILFGPPGSGKGTQAKLIAKKLGYKHISTGDLLRDLEKNPTAKSEELQALSDMKNGGLAASWLIYTLAFKAIERGLKENGGVILDGAVRSIEQAKEYDNFFVKHGWQKEVLAIELSLPDEDALSRLTKRKICDKCGDIVIWDRFLDKVSICKKCGGNLVTRVDDNPKAALSRIESQGNKVIAPILQYYKKQGVLAIADGSAPIKEVSKELLNILSNYYIWRLLNRVKKLISFFKAGK